MHYKCENCLRQFEFDDYIVFCPYCGKSLDGSFSASKQTGAEKELVQVIDSIWGDSARIKREFSNNISSCIRLVNDFAKSSIEKALPNQDLSKYEEYYSVIKQSNNRKTLINRIDDFLELLETTINNLSNRIPADTTSKIEKAVYETGEMCKELYDFLGLRYAKSFEDSFLLESYSAEVLYSKEQLITLYNLVLVAYSKYKKCVEDNNMFAAFASTSNYGMLTDYWRRWLSALSKKENYYKDDENREDPKFDQVIHYMKIHNSEKYSGLLDEDFVPHVDAFWYGLEMLCEFLDHHFAVDCNINNLSIDDDERSKLLRIIASKEYIVNDSRLDGAIDLKKRFEEKTEALHENNKDEKRRNIN